MSRELLNVVWPVPVVTFPETVEAINTIGVDAVDEYRSAKFLPEVGFQIFVMPKGETKVRTETPAGFVELVYLVSVEDHHNGMAGVYIRAEISADELQSIETVKEIK